MLAVPHNPVAVARGRFAYLMGLYAENYWRLTRAFGPQQLAPGAYVSSVGDGLDLSFDVVERHAYTLDLRLSYQFIDAVSGQPDPSACVRLYSDARMAEVNSCYVGARLQHMLGEGASARTVADHRLRMNSFLNKWLEYLEERGHSRFTLRDTAIAPAA